MKERRRFFMCAVKRFRVSGDPLTFHGIYNYNIISVVCQADNRGTVRLLIVFLDSFDFGGNLLVSRFLAGICGGSKAVVAFPEQIEEAVA